MLSAICRRPERDGSQSGKLAERDKFDAIQENRGAVEISEGPANDEYGKAIMVTLETRSATTRLRRHHTKCRADADPRQMNLRALGTRPSVACVPKRQNAGRRST